MHRFAAAEHALITDSRPDGPVALLAADPVFTLDSE